MTTIKLFIPRCIISKLNLVNILQNQPVFKQVDKQTLTHIAQQVTEVRLDKGKVLFERGSQAREIYIVVFGLIKLSVSSSVGQEKVLELIRPGQSIGEAVMFTECDYPFTAQALEDSLLVHVPQRVVFQIIEHNPFVARRLLSGLSHRLLGFMRDVERYSLQNATQRVASYLLQAAEHQGAAVIHLEIKKVLLASLLNLTPETLSRVLHQLCDEQLIAVDKRMIHILSLDKLRALQTQAA